VSEAADDGLQIDVTQAADDGPVLVALDGELDLVSSRTFLQAVAELQRLQPAQVVFDLAGLAFVDSSGINALVQAVRAIEAEGGGAVLAAPSGPARRVFEITRAHEIVTIAEDRETALHHATLALEHDTAADDVR
jgi:anti-sigma B factor antagonist